MDEELGPKAAAFMAALRELCVKHGVVLATGGYDGALDVWDRNGDEDVIYSGTMIHDMTSSAP